MYYDTHVHTNFSHDTETPLQEYTAAIDKGRLKGIGFAEHLDFMPECGGYGLFKYNKYIEAIRSKEQAGYELFAGAEVDYSKRVEEDIINFLKENPFDYTIVSVHMVSGLSLSDKLNLHLLNDKEFLFNLLCEYYSEVLDSVKVEEFDVIGHIGIFKRYLKRELLEDAKLLKEIHAFEDEIARQCVLSGKIVEVNTSGLFSPLGKVLPDKTFLEAYHKYGGTSLSIGSDAHTANHLVRGFTQARELLKDIGFKHFILPWDKEKKHAI